MPTGMMKLHAELGGEFPAPDQSAQPADTGPGADAMADTRSWQFSGDEAPTGSPEGAQDPLAELMRLAGQSATATRPAPRPRVQPASASNDELHQVEAAVLLAQGIPLLPPEGISLKQHLIDVEKSLIEQALRLKDGNVSQTARILQLQRTTLIEKINKYDLRSVD